MFYCSKSKGFNLEAQDVHPSFKVFGEVNQLQVSMTAFDNHSDHNVVPV